MAFDHNDGYRPDEDNHREDGKQEEGFVETLDRLTDGGWRLVLAAIAIALPIAGLIIWVYETYVIVPLP